MKTQIRFSILAVALHAALAAPAAAQQKSASR